MQLFADVNLFDEELEGGGGVAVFVFFDCVADVEGLSGMDAVKIFSHIKGNAVEDFPAGVVNKFQLDVL
jgi:hypothetical protein